MYSYFIFMIIGFLIMMLLFISIFWLFTSVLLFIYDIVSINPIIILMSITITIFLLLIKYDNINYE